MNPEEEQEYIHNLPSNSPQEIIDVVNIFYELTLEAEGGSRSNEKELTTKTEILNS